MDMKRCPTCGEDQPVDAFYRNRARPDGRAAQCKACERSHRERNPEPSRASRASWEKRNPESVRSKQREFHARHRARRNRAKQSAREANPLAYIEARYGITPNEYESMYGAQNGRCAICGATHSRLHIDHDHGTSEVRGLLCKKCNLALGFLRDDPEIALRAAAYLQTSASDRTIERSA